MHSTLLRPRREDDKREASSRSGIERAPVPPECTCSTLKFRGGYRLRLAASSRRMIFSRYVVASIVPRTAITGPTAAIL